MNKLIKLSETRYVVVNDSQIKEGDYFIDSGVDICKSRNDLTIKGKITHSTEMLGFLTLPGISTANLKPDWESVKQLSLSEVEEVVCGYNFEKMAYNSLYEEGEFGVSKLDINKWIKGFKAHQELVKDKLFTIEDMASFMFNTIEKICEVELRLWKQSDFEDVIKEFVKRKSSWDVEFDEQGKIKLI